MKTDVKEAFPGTLMLQQPPVPKFRIMRMPWLASIYLQARIEGLSQHPLRKLKGLLLSRLFRWGARFPAFSKEGLLETEIQGKRLVAPFNPSNLQFRAVYMPVYRYGYEATTGALLSALADKSTIFYDIGSNWGFFSILLASRPDYCGNVFAFEPNPVARRDMEKILIALSLSDVVLLQDCGLGTKTETMKIAASSMWHTGRTRLLRGARNGVSVAVKRLDDLSLPPPDLIKLDVEGMELDVLRGGERMVARSKPFIVFESWSDPDNPASSKAVFRFLRTLGYDFFIPGFTFGRGDGDGEITVQGDSACAALWDEGQQYRLSITSCNPDVRPLMEAHLNFFACHHDRIDEAVSRINAV